MTLDQDKNAPGEGADQPAYSSTTNEGDRSIEAVYHVPVRISAVLGKALVPVSHLLKLSKGSVIELDKRVGEPVDLFVNDKLVAKGEVVVVDDKLGVTMTEMIRS